MIKLKAGIDGKFLSNENISGGIPQGLLLALLVFNIFFSEINIRSPTVTCRLTEGLANTEFYKRVIRRKDAPQKCNALQYSSSMKPVSKDYRSH